LNANPEALLATAFTALLPSLERPAFNEANLLPFKKLWIYTCLVGKVNTVSNLCRTYSPPY